MSSFSLDAFEVTVGRFRRFVAQYPASKPSDETGKNTHNTDDAGWDPNWTAQLPLGQDELLAELEECDGDWTTIKSGLEDHPMNCVTWFEALAFCIWDGGRLPTEAEWNYAAAGGDEGRVYPWTKLQDPVVINETYAVYQNEVSPPSAPASVGSVPNGISRWSQYDLAGNVSEWVWDGSTVCYQPGPCRDCGKTLGYQNKITRGGTFAYDADYITVQTRIDLDAATRDPRYGFRCARDL